MDRYFMKLALDQAKKARNLGEVPIGAILVRNGKIVSTAYNMRELLKNPLAHAEVLAIDCASKELKSWRLLDTTMYVTIEPCPMCAGAIVNARIKRLVIGAKDPKMGACGSVMNLVENDSLNHKLEVEYGVLEDECSNIVKDFFKELRKKHK